MVFVEIAVEPVKEIKVAIAEREFGPRYISRL